MKQATKLNPTRVAAILKEIASPCCGCGRPRRLADIAKRHGISKTMVHHIKVGRSWPDVPVEVAVTAMDEADAPR